VLTKRVPLSTPQVSITNSPWHELKKGVWSHYQREATFYILHGSFDSVVRDFKLRFSTAHIILWVCITFMKRVNLKRKCRRFAEWPSRNAVWRRNSWEGRTSRAGNGSVHAVTHSSSSSTWPTPVRLLTEVLRDMWLAEMVFIDL